MSKSILKDDKRRLDFGETTELLKTRKIWKAKFIVVQFCHIQVGQIQSSLM